MTRSTGAPSAENAKANHTDSGAKESKGAYKRPPSSTGGGKSDAQHAADTTRRFWHMLGASLLAGAITIIIIYSTLFLLGFFI